MTPERCKNILPTGPSLFPNRSFSPQQWKEVLRTCQAMFLKGQWKQCSSYCIQILIETDDQPSLYLTYVNFYAALSIEATARAFHTLSPARVRNLELALRYYEKAEAALPPSELPIIIDDHYGSREEVEVDESEGMSVEDHGHSQASRTCYSPSSLQSDAFIADTLFPKPPSLRSSVSATHHEMAIPDSDSLHGTDSPLSADFRTSEHLLTPFIYQPRQQSRAYTGTWLHNRSVELYNSQLTQFETLLHRHIATVVSLVALARDFQASRATANNMPDSVNNEGKTLLLTERIQRLRSCGWSRERFDPSRYEQLCEDALADF